MSDKYAEARDFLEEVWSQLDNEFDLAGNTVKNGVKTGGGKRGGGQFLDLYISYRNAERWNVNLAWLQDEPQTEAYLRVQLYKAYNKRCQTLNVMITTCPRATPRLKSFGKNLRDCFKADQ